MRTLPRRSELKVTDAIFQSANQDDFPADGGDDTAGLFQLIDASNGNVVPSATNAANVRKLRIGRKQWAEGEDYFQDADTDYGKLLAAAANATPFKVTPFNPSTGVTDPSVYFTFTPGSPVVFDDMGNADRDFYTIPGTLAATGAPVNNNDLLWRFEFEESEVEVLGENVVNPAAIVDGEQVGSPSRGIVVADTGKLKAWAVDEASAHIIGPDTKALSLGGYDISAGLPSTAGKVYVGSPVSDLRQVNITWASADADTHLMTYLRDGARIEVGSWEAEVSGMVTRNTVANGGYQFQVKPISTGNPLSSGSALVSLLGSVVHWADADPRILPVGQAGDVAYHDGTEWRRLPKGTDGQVLKLASGIPAWAADESASGGGGPALHVVSGLYSFASVADQQVIADIECGANTKLYATLWGIAPVANRWVDVRYRVGAGAWTSAPNARRMTSVKELQDGQRGFFIGVKPWTPGAGDVDIGLRPFVSSGNYVVHMQVWVGV